MYIDREIAFPSKHLKFLLLEDTEKNPNGAPYVFQLLGSSEEHPAVKELFYGCWDDTFDSKNV